MSYLLNNLQLHVIDSGMKSDISEFNIEEVQLAEYLELTRTMAVLIYVSDPTIIECVEQAAIVEDASVFKDVTERV